MDENNIITQIPIREQVAIIIRKMILKGELKGGEQVSERKIGELLNVSTTPVKEALRILQAEGLVYTMPRKGSYISTIAKKSIMQIVFMRSALEGVAAFFAAQNASPKQIEIMEKALAEAESLSALKAGTDIIGKKNLLFHDTIRKAAGNQYLLNLINTMNSIDIVVRDITLKIDEELKREHREHLAILEAIKNADGNEAERLMVSHIRRGVLFVNETYKGMEK
jgi:DNA-binding GntR family transcriptional regulator